MALLALTTAERLTLGGIIVGLLAVLVAFFKDELWHWLDAPRLETKLVPEPYPSFGWVLQIRNLSHRLPAQGVTVRAIELEPHPLEYCIGPKWSTHIIQADRLVPRRGGEGTFNLAPQSEVALPLFEVGGAWTDTEAATAKLPWWNGPASATEDREGLLVLPSMEEREGCIDPYPMLRPIEKYPAMLRLEVAATNVPAALCTVKISRDLDAWPGEAQPGNPAFHRGTFTATLESGSAPHNPAPHAGQMMPSDEVPVRDKPWVAMLEQRRAAQAEVR